MGIVESAQFVQDQYQHAEIIKYEKKGYKTDGRAYNLDLISTLREDLRDLCSQQYKQIDTIMLISTLTLSVSFGFVYKGTFPGGWDGINYFDDLEWRWYTPILMAYSCSLALSIVLPFWSIFAALHCKNTLDRYCHRILDIQLASSRMDLNTWLDQYDYFDNFWEDKCKWHFNLAYSMFWAGIFGCFVTVSLLLGINFFHYYEIRVFIIFTIIVGGNVLFAIVWLAVKDPLGEITRSRLAIEEELDHHIRSMSQVSPSPSGDALMDAQDLQRSLPRMASPEEMRSESPPRSHKPSWSQS